MPRLYLICLSLLLLWARGVSAAEAEWQSLLPRLDPARDVVAGSWQRNGNELVVAAATGARLALPTAPAGEYDFRVSFTRRTGVHSVAMIFVHGGRQATFEVDAWGRQLSGLQNIGGRDLRQNGTQREGQRLENGRRYTMTIEVRRDEVRALLDDELLATYRGDGSDLSLLNSWRMSQATHLGIGAWDSETVFHAIDVRRVDGKPLATPQATASTPRVPSSPSPASRPGSRGKRVLIVIANQDFFYREYAEPREELERAGVPVTVAAGRKAACRPHSGTGEGADGGMVQPDLALSEVRAADFDAILFSGGWGSSAYQFAFPGRYSNQVYNGDPAVKAEVNRIINEFLTADKYVCALCNAVSVLAWARVNGKSPLEGKRVCAPVREAAVGIYDGRQAQPSCRWHPERNGAILSPPGAIGDPRTNTDDVLVDGRIITGEDDTSAREMGRTIVRVLSE